MDEKPQKSKRLAGTGLRLAAKLMETPGLGALLYRVAAQQLGLDRLRTAQVPGHAPLYIPLHRRRDGEG